MFYTHCASAGLHYSCLSQWVEERLKCQFFISVGITYDTMTLRVTLKRLICLFENEYLLTDWKSMFSIFQIWTLIIIELHLQMDLKVLIKCVWMSWPGISTGNVLHGCSDIKTSGWDILEMDQSEDTIALLGFLVWVTISAKTQSHTEIVLLFPFLLKVNQF